MQINFKCRLFRSQYSERPFYFKLLQKYFLRPFIWSYFSSFLRYLNVLQSIQIPNVVFRGKTRMTIRFRPRLYCWGKCLDAMLGQRSSYIFKAPLLFTLLLNHDSTISGGTSAVVIEASFWRLKRGNRNGIFPAKPQQPSIRVISFFLWSRSRQKQTPR